MTENLPSGMPAAMRMRKSLEQALEDFRHIGDHDDLGPKVTQAGIRTQEALLWLNSALLRL